VGSAAAGTSSNPVPGAPTASGTLLLLWVTGSCCWGARLSTYCAASQPAGCTTTCTCTGSFMGTVAPCRRSNSRQLSPRPLTLRFCRVQRNRGNMRVMGAVSSCCKDRTLLLPAACISTSHCCSPPHCRCCCSCYCRYLCQIQRPTGLPGAAC
jgi:hypothetical protein